MVQATESDIATADNVHPFPGPAPEPPPRSNARPKDPTSATCSKRYRKNRKRDAKRDGRVAVRQSSHDGKPVLGGEIPHAEKQNEIKAGVAVHDASPWAPDMDAHTSSQRHGRDIRFAALIAALGWQPSWAASRSPE